MPDKNAKTVPAALIELYQGIGQSLSSLAPGDGSDPFTLGEPWLSQLKDIKGKINASLAGLDPTDQVQAAQQAANGLDYLKNQLLVVQSIITSLGAVVKAKSEMVARTTASLAPGIEAAIDGKLKSGEFVSKSTYDAAVASARKEGETSGLEKGKLLNARTMALASANIDPSSITVIPSEILSGDEKKFSDAKDIALKRTELLAAIGIAKASMGKLLWTEEPAFTEEYTRYKQIHDSAMGHSTNSASGSSQSKQQGTTTSSPAVFATGAGSATAAKIQKSLASRILC